MNAQDTSPSPSSPLPRYATQLIQSAQVPAGCVVVRPVLAQDLGLLDAFYRTLTRQTLHQRFHVAMPGLSEARIQEATRQGLAGSADHLVIVATLINDMQEEQVVGHAGWVIDRGGDEGPKATPVADFALVVADAHQGHGIGAALMKVLMQGGQAAGLHWLRAGVLTDNPSMLGLMHKMGCWCAPLPDEDGVVEVLAKVVRERAAPRQRRVRDRWLQAWARLHRGAGEMAP